MKSFHKIPSLEKEEESAEEEMIIKSTYSLV